MPQLQPERPPVPVSIATTVMLSFISFWRAAAIVLDDLASSAYDAGGDAEKVLAKVRPGSFLPSCCSATPSAPSTKVSSMFVRGGVYRVVRQAMGDTLAKLSVSALLFDYILTGPISAVTAGQYLAGFIEEAALHYLKHPLHFNANYFAATFGILAILYFWWKNIEGIQESSDKALWIMKITTIMVIVLIA